MRSSELQITEVIPAGELSRPETVRGRALRLAQGTITDAELVEWFIQERAGTPDTRRNYAAQLRRLLWFSDRRLGLPSVRNLQREDWDELNGYLASPPAEDIMSTSVGVDHPDWRPFRGPLKGSSVTQALTSIVQFMAWMADPSIGAIQASPFGKLKPRRQRVTRTGATVARYLNAEALAFLSAALEAEPAAAASDASAAERVMATRYSARRKWILVFGLMTGLRASELARARSSMMKPDPRGGWVLEIVRKGGAASRLPLSDHVVTAWHRYRDAQGIPAGADVPLIGQIDSRLPSMAASNALTRQAIWGIIKSACESAAALAQAAGDSHAEETLLQCSTHWVRHTFAVQLLDTGADLRSAQDLLEHASIATTSGYLHIDAERRRTDLDRMSAKVAGDFLSRPPESR